MRFDRILVRRISDPAKPPGPGALVKQCSNCNHDVWVHPRTVEDTGLKAPLVCWECDDGMPKKGALYVIPFEED